MFCEERSRSNQHHVWTRSLWAILLNYLPVLSGDGGQLQYSSTDHGPLAVHRISIRLFSERVDLGYHSATSKRMLERELDLGMRDFLADQNTDFL